MKGKAVSGIMLTLLLISILPLAFDVQPVKADPGTIYIRADGSIDPPTAPITAVDNVTYTLTGNIYDSIVIERDNIVVDGASYVVAGTVTGYTRGIDLSWRSNVTVKNVEVKTFWYGIYLNWSSHNVVFDSNITNSARGVWVRYSSNNSVSGSNIISNNMGVDLAWSSNNTISGNRIENGIDLWYESSHNTINGNNITNGQEGVSIEYSSNSNDVSGNTMMNNEQGVYVFESSSNTISENNIMNNTGTGITLGYSSDNFVSRNILVNNHVRGIGLDSSSNNTLSGNTITNNTRGISLTRSNYNNVSGNNVTANSNYGIRLRVSAENMIYHNKFANNVNVLIEDTDPASYWDNGYPSGGNHWSDYTGVDVKSGPNQDQSGSDGIGDTQYIIDDDFSTRDHYPLTKPYGGPYDIGITNITIAKTVVGQGYNLNVNFKTINYGINTETFNFTSHANTTLITALTNITLPSRNSTTILFTWNTTNVAKGNYNITLCVTPVPNETYIEDNAYTYWVLITIMGDVDGDLDVDVGDQRKVQLAMFSVPGDPNWNYYADVDCDNDVDVGDQRKQQLHMFESW